MVRVMTVDDNAPFLAVAREVVQHAAGFESVGEARSGAEALAAIEEARPDLVLVDVRMPGIDGIEFTRRIQRSPEAAVVVLITAEDLAQLPAAANTCGAAAILRKQDLRPARLAELWRAHGTASANRA
jgi:two-component system, NarL family, invasion response regulator UvrY